MSLEVLTAKFKAIKWHKYTEAKNKAKIEARFGLLCLATPKQLFFLTVKASIDGFYLSTCEFSAFFKKRRLTCWVLGI